MAPVIPIAIIGTGCRYPGGASSPSRLWELLRDPRDVASTPAADRFNLEAFYQPGQPRAGTMNVRESYFLKEDIRSFDASFFNISPIEAASMDPQQRLLLEVVYESLERAGLPLERLQGSSTGVYCGCMNYDYDELLIADPDVLPPFALSGTSASMMATRLSYFFDWHGPSLVLNTACSASLSALHVAVEALQTGDCPLAIATGSCLILSPDKYIAASQMHMLSPTGRSHMWDVAADGYARGEGIAAVVLKRLDDALRDGDHIESIIRATAVNCDGRTKSLTMPNGAAQRELIRTAYARAGLDPLSPKDRCQYFEAHGTGTPAGDPQEAEGISSALFDTSSAADEFLYVGSIKTIIGHSEASAGISGIIKASLALQHSVIPPNLLLKQISPQVAPYTSRLRVPTQALPWPRLPAGTPRRASVSSFSFGGANAHAILESFEEADRESAPDAPVVPTVLPFVFSAASEKSLQAVLQQFVGWLKEHSTVDLLDLSSTLMTRRSTLSHRLVLSADSVQGLEEKLKNELAPCNPTDVSSIITRRLAQRQTRVLGVFTGQGAQWPQMGLDLITACPQAAAWLQELQESLNSLPDEYRPNFTLLGELAAPECSSRLHSASVSLPLRTALQVLQVNILRTLGITFSTVVGHSSGEIAAAYAAGWLSASDAIRIAYLRGVAVQNAISEEQSGSMLAVGISLEQAQAICSEPPYEGRVVVAAVNSPSNVTFSGDTEMISELEWLFESLDYAPRRLRVDTAYHSHHMVPCSGPYLEAMIKCHVGGGPERSGTKWISSVYGGHVMSNMDPHYWSENMVRPVHFLEALKTALQMEPDLSMMVEVGPHPALKGPSLDTLSTIRPEKADMPYVSLARRGAGGVESLALGVGACWAYLGSQSLDIPAYVRLFDSSRQLKYISSLPTYPFDHSQTYWAVPRLSTARITRRWPKHPLLGVPSPETGEGEWRWRNLLRTDDLPWADGHRVQSQILLPATAYLVMALEAAYLIAEDRVLQLVEICEMTIDRAIPIDDDSAGVETLFTLYETDSDPGHLSASFTCQLSVNGTYRRCASGRIDVMFGDQDPDLLPSRGPVSSGLRSVDAEQFYTELNKLGLGYRGLFRRLTAIQRRRDVAYGAIPASGADPDDGARFLVHPATLDVSLQALMAAIGSPGDGQLCGLYLPTRLERTTINPIFCHTGTLYPPQGDFVVEARLGEVGVEGYTGDIHLFDADGRTFVQIEGMQVSQLRHLDDEDWPMFAEEVLGPLVPNATIARALAPPYHRPSRALTDRASLLYLQDTQRQLTSEDRHQLDGHRGQYVAWMDRLLARVRDGTHPLYSMETLAGDPASTLSLAAHQASPAEIQTLEVTARNLLDWLRGGTSIMEALRQDNLLTRLYRDHRDFGMMTHQLATLVGQLAFRYPRMKILEVGAGTGSATRMVLDQIVRDYHSYTYTDISAAFFEDAQEAFAAHGDRIIYKVLDLEEDPIEQGFAEHGYDLVIGSNCLHATHRLKQTMTNVRRLLKPGGRVAIFETTDPEHVSSCFTFGVFEGWWLGEADGRPFGPLIARGDWERLLQSTGFSGFEAISSDADAQRLGMSVFTARAVDDQILRWERPLAVPAQAQYRDLILLGGATAASESLLSAVRVLVGPYFASITVAPTLDAFVTSSQTSLAVVLSLSDIDSPCLQGLTTGRLRGLQEVIAATGTLLWVAPDSPIADPYLRMSKGLLRSLAFENSHAQFQHLAVRDPGAVSADLVATTLMRLVHTNFDSDYSLSTYTENTEWELVFEGGVLKVPRLRSSAAMNQRWLVSRGVSKSQRVDPGLTCVEVRSTDNEQALLAPVSSSDQIILERNGLAHNTALVCVRSHYVTQTAVRISESYLYLVLGRREVTNERVMALSIRHASMLRTPASWCWPVPDKISEEEEAAFLSDVCSALLARHLIYITPPGSNLLVHDASDGLQLAVDAFAAPKTIKVHYSTSQRQRHNPATVLIPPRCSTKTLSRLLPAKISVLASIVPDKDETVLRLQSALDPGLKYFGGKAFYGPSFLSRVDLETSELGETLSTACVFAEQRRRSGFPSQANILFPEDIPMQCSLRHPLHIVDWLHSGRVHAHVRSASSVVDLSSQKTYLLVGMTGDLGRLICHWMITRGARSVVLTSRSPHVDPLWLEEMSALGALVTVMAMDVADPSSIALAHKHIQTHLPPVGGVVNGALVMGDAAFADLTLTDMLSIFAPKVEGTRLLDDLYGGADLDFFLLMGSLTGPCGNFHQTAYAAATEYMAALVHQRHLRGLAASIIHPSQIRGVGYIAGLDEHLRDGLEQGIGPLCLSERDLLELVAEGILAGRPGSARSPEILGGFRMTDPNEYPDVRWYRNPKMWSFIKHFSQSEVTTTAHTEVTLRDQLLTAANMPEATEIIAHGLCEKLRRKLLLPDHTPLPTTVLLTDIGVDSLIAVDLRTWFIKELGVDMPVLQLLGGSSLEVLAASAANKLEHSLVPLAQAEPLTQ